MLTIILAATGSTYLDPHSTVLSRDLIFFSDGDMGFSLQTGQYLMNKKKNERIRGQLNLCLVLSVFTEPHDLACQ